ncbi:mediator of RNA polymerase II transcription subunit 15a-like [Eucalyptus grandis]|uniref:mediator of RNA polymerase II transcription subunit 15a-like n=1 Tax=Eucalyptus grandis TaxID=71139 RepID=UPI00192F0A7D|nr:mediator of RNA polymerase II transcription subunit 15a-like [Eucalyptus grandis]
MDLEFRCCARRGRLEGSITPESRERIVHKIIETLKRHLPVSGPEGLQELKKIAVRFEEKNYTAAISQSDYLRKISLKMLSMETKSQNTIPNALPSNPAGNSSDLGNLHHNSVSSLSGVSNAQQTMINSPQPNSNVDSGQGNAFEYNDG